MTTIDHTRPLTTLYACMHPQCMTRYALYHQCRITQHEMHEFYTVICTNKLPRIQFILKPLLRKYITKLLNGCYYKQILAHWCHNRPQLVYRRGRIIKWIVRYNHEHPFDIIRPTVCENVTRAATHNPV
jgi:hypothetical protein